MKRVYWRPRGLSRTALVLLAALSVAGIAAVERFQRRTRQPDFETKWEAATLARRAMEVIRAERARHEPEIDELEDPAESGLIGPAMTPVTSDPGSLPAKRTSINPNFTAVLVQWLREAGVGKDDVVAVGLSGSFPALNICVYAALQTLGARPVIISSASASQWGANLPDLLWLDMEKLLHEKGFFRFRSAAASVGGVDDRGLGMDQEGRRLLEEGIRRAGVTPLSPESFGDSIDRRMALYREQAGGAPIKAYINVGGGTTSVGTTVGKQLFQPGLNLTPPPGAKDVPSVMARFSVEGVKVIHLTQIEKLASRYGLESQPRELPQVGQGAVFYRKEYNLWIAAAVLALIVLSLYSFVHTEIGVRFLQSPARPRSVLSQEPMI